METNKNKQSWWNQQPVWARPSLEQAHKDGIEDAQRDSEAKTRDRLRTVKWERGSNGRRAYLAGYVGLPVDCHALELLNHLDKLASYIP